MQYAPGDVVYLRPATLEAKNIERESLSIDNVTGLVKGHIIAYVGGRSYEVELESGQRETLGSRAFVKTGGTSHSGGIRRLP